MVAAANGLPQTAIRQAPILTYLNASWYHASERGRNTRRHPAASPDSLTMSLPAINFVQEGEKAVILKVRARFGAQRRQTTSPQSWSRTMKKSGIVVLTAVVFMLAGAAIIGIAAYKKTTHRG